MGLFNVRNDDRTNILFGFTTLGQMVRKIFPLILFNTRIDGRTNILFVFFQP